MNRKSLRSRAILLLILAAFLVLAGLYSALVPLFESPDENAHVDLIRFLRAEKRLPEQGEAGEAHQPPLYYLLATLVSLPSEMDDLAVAIRYNPDFMWAGSGQDINIIYHTAAEAFPWRGSVLAIHLMRALSLLMGVGTILIVYLTGREIFSHSVIPLAAAAIVAFNPQFVFISSVVNNDNLANLCSALAIWMMIRLLMGRAGRWTLIVLGISLGAGLLTKQNLLVLVPLAGLSLAYASFRERSARILLEGVLILAGAVIIITGWWYWRNQALYGDLFGVSAFLAHRPQENSAVITNFETLSIFLEKMHQSLWGTFGWMNVQLPLWIYRALLALYALVGLGLGLAWYKKRQTSSRPWAALVLLGSLPLFFVLWVLTYGYRFGGSGWQGRYLFPALPAIAILFAAGLANLLPGQRRNVPGLFVGLVLVALTAWALPSTLLPAYLRVTQPVSALDDVQVPMDVNFGNLIHLSGYDLSVLPGDTKSAVEITLYWRATGQPTQDYKVFVHLVSADWELFGQGDGYPLDGEFPTSVWRDGDLVLDPHAVQLTQVIVPGEYKIATGWYLESTGERLPILQGEQEAGTVAETVSFMLLP